MTVAYWIDNNHQLEKLKVDNKLLVVETKLEDFEEDYYCLILDILEFRDVVVVVVDIGFQMIG